MLVKETKSKNLELAVMRRIWDIAELKIAQSGAEGNSGGILTMWNHEVFKENQTVIHKHFILITGALLGFACAIVNVYAPNDSNSRREVWIELLQLKSAHPVPWCVGGDFNEIKAIGERVGCTRIKRSMRDFQDFIENAELKDLPLMGRRFNWTNFQNAAIQSRLDRFLISEEWLDRLKLFNGDFQDQSQIIALS